MITRKAEINGDVDRVVNKLKFIYLAWLSSKFNNDPSAPSLVENYLYKRMIECCRAVTRATSNKQKDYWASVTKNIETISCEYDDIIKSQRWYELVLF